MQTCLLWLPRHHHHRHHRNSHHRTSLCFRIHAFVVQLRRQLQLALVERTGVHALVAEAELVEEVVQAADAEYRPQ